MALTFKRKKDGSFKITKRTGFDAVEHRAMKAASAASKVARSVFNAPSRFLDEVEKRDKKVQDARRKRNRALIDRLPIALSNYMTRPRVHRAFGGVENFRRLDGMFRDR